MKECVVIEGYMKGACSNCWKNSKQVTLHPLQVFLLHAIRYTLLIHIDKDKEPSKELKIKKKRSRHTDDDIVDLTSDAASASTQTLNVTPKKRKTVSVSIPSRSTSTRGNPQDWGSPLNVKSPGFTPRLEPKHAADKKKVTPKPILRNSFRMTRNKLP
jgi:hypothetical protein